MENGTHDIRLIIVDLDGTLLKDDHTMSDKNRDTLRKAIEQGVEVVLATGKTRASAEEIIKELNLKTPGVYVQGTMVYNSDGTIRWQQKIDSYTARRAINYAESNGFQALIYSGNRLIARRNEGAIADLAKYHEPEPQGVGPLVNIIEDTVINKIILLGGSESKIKALRWQLNQQIGTQVAFTHTAINSHLEILPKGISKGIGVQKVLKELNVEAQHVMAIGDAENDRDMLKLVGLGVAVGNATEALKEVADEIVKSNEEDGVAEAVEKFVLKKAEETSTSPAAEADTAEATPSDETPKSEETSTTPEAEATQDEAQSKGKES